MRPLSRLSVVLALLLGGCPEKGLLERPLSPCRPLPARTPHPIGSVATYSEFRESFWDETRILDLDCLGLVRDPPLADGPESLAWHEEELRRGRLVYSASVAADCLQALSTQPCLQQPDFWCEGALTVNATLAPGADCSAGKSSSVFVFYDYCAGSARCFPNADGAFRCSAPPLFRAWRRLLRRPGLRSGPDLPGEPLCPTGRHRRPLLRGPPLWRRALLSRRSAMPALAPERRALHAHWPLRRRLRV